MSILDEIAALTPPKGPPCTLRSILGSLPPEDRADLERALTERDAIGQPRYRTSAISAALKARGFSIEEKTISRHRRGVCACPSQTS